MTLDKLRAYTQNVKQEGEKQLYAKIFLLILAGARESELYIYLEIVFFALLFTIFFGCGLNAAL